MIDADKMVDVLVIGGGVNGVGIARDAVGRGLSVTLMEKSDLASGTSSSSTKLFHGGLRYLEQYAFLLVRKALIEREVLLRNMPHISKPMRFVLPHSKGMRPYSLLAMGLYLYDTLGGRKFLPGTKRLDLRNDIAGIPLKSHFKRAFEYSDGWVDDARLVVLNAMDARARGAEICVQTRLTSARRAGDHWLVEYEDQFNGLIGTMRCKTLINAGGPWINHILETAVEGEVKHPIRLVRGSHIVVKKLFNHDRAYFFQNPDGRIMFAIPYCEDYTLLGTTDADHSGDLDYPECSDEEKAYLCKSASEYFAEPVEMDDIIWSYAGIRPLDDDASGKAENASRDYHIRVEDKDGVAPLINIYGGKITTYRKLSEQVVEELAAYHELLGKPWTHNAPLPGGDFPVDGMPDLITTLRSAYPFLSRKTLRRMAAAYGTMVKDVLGKVNSEADLGKDFGAGLYEKEVRYLMENEWARTAQDIVWRRTKCGLDMSAEQITALQLWLEKEHHDVYSGH